MKKSLLMIALLLTCLVSLSVAQTDYRAPSGASLPLEVKPMFDGTTPWQMGNGEWVLPPEKTGHLEAPAWWTGNRPPRGECVVLELEYLDNFNFVITGILPDGFLLPIKTTTIYLGSITYPNVPKCFHN